MSKKITPQPEYDALYAFDAENNIEPSSSIAERIAARHGFHDKHPIVDDIHYAIEDAMELGQRRGRLIPPRSQAESKSSANELRDRIAERIWRAEYRRATGKERSIEWAEVADKDVEKYLYVAEAIVQLLATPAGQRQDGAEPVAWFCFVDSPPGEDEPKRIRAWTSHADRAKSLGETIGREFVPLYALPSGSEASSGVSCPPMNNTRLIQVIEALIVSAEQNTDDDGNIYPHAARAIVDARKLYQEGT